ncbi:MAG: hypothetical protein HC799_07345 [Limnothrix sp. RL_2_0]|nr:hypothetical protein [Limnothrix sp. RL_2_0]
MFVNILIFLFSVAIAVLLFKFGLRTVSNFKTLAQRILPALGIVMLLLAINLGMTFYAKAALQQTANLPAVSSLAELEQVESDSPIALVAIASPDNPIRGRNNEYLAYVDGNGLWTPRVILFDLDDGQIAMDNDNYKTRNWPRDNQLRYINPEQPVVVMGEAIKSLQVTGTNIGEVTYRIKGILVFAGSHTEFKADLTRRLWGPRIMAGLNAFALGAIALGTIIAAFRVWRKSKKVDASQPG